MKRKPGIQVKCEICGKLVFERGLKAHLRLLHKLKITKVTKVTKVATPVRTKVNTQVKPPDRTQVFKEVIEVTRQYKPLYVHCKRCGRLIETNDLVQETIDRLRDNFACDSCIDEFYTEDRIVFAIKANTFDKNGNSVLNLSKQLK